MRNKGLDQYDLKHFKCKLETLLNTFLKKKEMERKRHVKLTFKRSTNWILKFQIKHVYFAFKYCFHDQ